MEIENIIRAINIASYENKEIVINTNTLVQLKREIEKLRDRCDAKDKMIRLQKNQIDNLTSKLVHTVKKFDEYIWLVHRRKTLKTYALSKEEFEEWTNEWKIYKELCYTKI